MAKERKLRGMAKRASYFVSTASGEYVYQGPLYAARPSGRITLKQASILRWVMGLLILGLAVADGCLPIPEMNGVFYVLLPYVAGLICAAMLLWAVCRMGRGDEALREYVYESTARALPVRTAASAICSALTLLGEVVFLFRGGGSGTGVWVLTFFILSQGLIFCLSMLWFFVERAFVWEKQT